MALETRAGTNGSPNYDYCYSIRRRLKLTESVLCLGLRIVHRCRSHHAVLVTRSAGHSITAQKMLSVGFTRALVKTCMHAVWVYVCCWVCYLPIAVYQQFDSCVSGPNVISLFVFSFTVVCRLKGGYRVMQSCGAGLVCKENGRHVMCTWPPRKEK